MNPLPGRPPPSSPSTAPGGCAAARRGGGRPVLHRPRPGPDTGAVGPVLLGATLPLGAGRGGGAGSAVAAVAVNARPHLAPSWRRAGELPGRRLGGVPGARRGGRRPHRPYLVLVLLGGGLAEPAHGRRARPPTALGAFGRGCWPRACRRPRADPGLGRVQGGRLVLRRRLRHHPPDAGRAVTTTTGSRMPSSSTPWPWATYSGTGRPDRGRGRLRRRGTGRGPAGRPGRLDPVVCLRAGRRAHFDRLRANRTAQAFLAGAGPAAIGAIAGASVPLAAGPGPALAGGAAGRGHLAAGPRRGAVPALVGAGAIGVIGALAGLPVGPEPVPSDGGPRSGADPRPVHQGLARRRWPASWRTTSTTRCASSPTGSGRPSPGGTSNPGGRGPRARTAPSSTSRHGGGPAGQRRLRWWSKGSSARGLPLFRRRRLHRGRRGPLRRPPAHDRSRPRPSRRPPR